jgi:FKBP-type peptidyl-prolyl cis-trans isomerase FkpA
VTEKADRARKRAERESRKYQRRGRFIFFGGLAVLLAIAAVIGVLVYRAVDKDSPPGLIIEDVEIGTGAEAVKGSAVSVDYTVWSENGTQLKTTSMGLPEVFTVGEHQVIEGLDQGVVGMKVGGKRKLTIPPNLCYGEEGLNLTVICEVVLLAVR